MKYSQLIGCIGVIILAGICYLPWSVIPERNIIVTGMSAPGTQFGKPGVMHLVLGIILFRFFILSKIWSTRLNLVVGAINFAWSIRNFILLSTCYMGECPMKKPGLYLESVFSLLIFIMTFLPDLEPLERTRNRK